MRRGEDIPEATRWSVYKRDNERCRMCGRANAYTYSVHHIRYRSAGGNNDLDNLILLCGSGSSDCHLKVHSNKDLYAPILQELVSSPGVTGLALLRRNRGTQDRLDRSGVPSTGRDPEFPSEPSARIRPFFADGRREQQS